MLGLELNPRSWSAAGRKAFMAGVAVFAVVGIGSTSAMAKKQSATSAPAASSQSAVRDVTITGKVAGATVNADGETLFGTIRNPATLRSADIRIGARTVKVSTDVTTGQFAFRIFPEDVASGRVNITVTPVRQAGAGTPEAFTFRAVFPNRRVDAIINRVTFGNTPGLAQYIAQIGPNAFIDEQLNASSNDAAFLATQPETLLRVGQREWEENMGLQEWRINHAAYSQRQLLEIMTNFWENHFWSIPKDGGLIYAQVQEVRDFRRLAFGKFSDLLAASMSSPVMMNFLDNDSNRRGAINENYARELLELHTVGVNGGYTNADIRAIAAAMTGWSLERVDDTTSLVEVRKRLVFKYKPEIHDATDKVIPFMNLTVKGRSGAEGMNEGKEIGAALARLPQTRKFICGKLVAHFVDESMPQSVLARCEDAWVRSDGTMRNVVSAILKSPEFGSPQYTRSKGRVPFEYMVAMLRAYGLRERADRDMSWSFDRTLLEAGQDLRSFSLPTGFDDESGKWLSTASLNGRLRNTSSMVVNDWGLNIDYPAMLRAQDIRTIEGAAAYLLSLATSDRFNRAEYEAVINAIRGNDGVLNWQNAWDVKSGLFRGVMLSVNLPSAQVQ